MLTTMQTETFRHRLDVYYLATIGYGVTLAAYTIVRGTLIGDTFSVVWQDPIVYLLAICAVIALVSLIVAAVSARRITVSSEELRFNTRFRERVFRPDEIEWVGFRRERSLREGKGHPLIRIKLRRRRRALRLRPGGFEGSRELTLAIRDFAQANGIEMWVGRRRGADGTTETSWRSRG